MKQEHLLNRDTRFCPDSIPLLHFSIEKGMSCLHCLPVPNSQSKRIFSTGIKPPETFPNAKLSSFPARQRRKETCMGGCLRISSPFCHQNLSSKDSLSSCFKSKQQSSLYSHGERTCGKFEGQSSTKRILEQKRNRSCASSVLLPASTLRKDSKTEQKSPIT